MRGRASRGPLTTSRCETTELGEDPIDLVMVALEAGMCSWLSTDRDGFSTGYCCRDGVFFRMLQGVDDDSPFLTVISRDVLRTSLEELREGIGGNSHSFVTLAQEAGDFLGVGLP